MDCSFSKRRSSGLSAAGLLLACFSAACLGNPERADAESPEELAAQPSPGDLKELRASFPDAFPSPHRASRVCLVFHKGIKCPRCMSALTAIGARQAKFDALEIHVIAICESLPKDDVLKEMRSQLGIEFAMRTDHELEHFRRFQCLDAKQQLLHGLFLFDENGKSVFVQRSEHAVTDVDDLLVQFRLALHEPGDDPR